MTPEEKYFKTIGQQLDDTEQSQLFGKPCFKIGGKAFVCFFQNQMVFKLADENHAEALSLEGSQLFDPSAKGRSMKQWVQVPYDHAHHWAGFAVAALEYVRGS